MNELKKLYKELKFTDDFMFAKVLVNNPEICRRLLEILLNIKIKSVSVPEKQKTIEILSDSKGIRLDVYVDDEEGTVYNIEMQKTLKTDLPKRSRYYQGMIDLNLIERGAKYKELKLSFVIFICLEVWPIELLTFAQMVCSECGLTLINESIPNGTYLVPQFTGDGVTGRKLMRWIGEICARFLRATPGGDVEFATYALNTAYTIGPYKRAAVVPLTDTVNISDDGEGNVVISSDLMTVEDDGEGNVTATSDVLNVTDNAGNVVVSAAGGTEMIPYYQNSLSYEDYQVALIEKVQIRLTDDDIGVVYPEVEGEVNTYIITGNYLLTTSTTDELLPVAQVIYEEISGITYTPCRVSIPVCLGINPGDIISITDKNGVTITAYVMTKTTTGQRDTLECTGSPRRDSSSVVNNEEYRALSGKVLEIRKQVEGLTVKNADANGRIAQLEMTVDGINTKVESQNEAIGQVRQDMTAIQQSAESVSIQVQNIIDNGVSKVITGKGYEFGDDGLHISDPTSEVKNLMDHTGMMVSNTDEMVLQANKDGVNTLNLTVRKYLIVPGSRFEEYADGTGEKFTACFAL